MGLDIELWAPSVAGICDELRAIPGIVHVREYANGLCRLDSADRYFGEGYTSGPWPQIRITLVAVRVLLPGLRYAADCYDCDETMPLVDIGIAVTDEWLAEQDQLWLEVSADRAVRTATAVSALPIPPMPIFVQPSRSNLAAAYALASARAAAQEDDKAAADALRTRSAAQCKQHTFNSKG